MILASSVRRNGKSLGQMAKEEIGPVAGMVALVAILGIMIVLIAVLALIVVNALGESPWGVVTVGLTIPIALLMGAYMRWIRPHKVLEATVMGLILLVVALYIGRAVAESPTLAPMFTLSRVSLAWIIMIYGFLASVLPVWLLLAPRDYLSAFVKIGVVAALALGILFVLPPLEMPALTRFVDGTGPVFAGKVFPFCFITIACGAISGFHALISSGTTPKLLMREPDARFIGYGAMLTESMVATLALIAACVLTPGTFFAINAPPSALGTTVESAAAAISELGLHPRPAGVHAAHRQRRRGQAPLAHRRRPVARRGHGPPLLERARRHDGDGALVPLRHHVRGAVHPHHARCGDAGGALHAAGPLATRLRTAREGGLVPGGADLQRDLRQRLGLLPLPGSRRPVRRDQFALAPLRDRQPAAGGGGALRGDDGDREDGEGALRLRHPHPAGRGSASSR